jgi:hypothetical protein
LQCNLIVDRNRIGKAYSSEYVDIRKVFIVALMSSKAILQLCVPIITSVHYCTDGASRVVEAQGCPGPVAKAGEVAHGAKSLEQFLGARPQQSKHIGEGPGQ